MVAHRKRSAHADHVEQLLSALRPAVDEKINFSAGLTAEQLAELAVMAGEAMSSDA